MKTNGVTDFTEENAKYNVLREKSKEETNVKQGAEQDDDDAVTAKAEVAVEATANAHVTSALIGTAATPPGPVPAKKAASRARKAAKA